MISDEGVARLREQFRLTMEGFLRTAAITPNGHTATALRAKAASYASVLEALDEANEEVPHALPASTDTR